MSNLTEYLNLIKSGVNEFDGSKKYIATGSLETQFIKDYEIVDYTSRPSRANMEFEKNDIIFAKMKDTEKVFLIDEDSSGNIYSTGFAGLRIKDLSKIHPKYVFYWLRSNLFQLEKNKKCTGATQKAISNSNIKKIPFPLASLEYQKKAITQLDEINKLIDYRKKSINFCDKYIRSIFNQYFGNLEKNEKNWPIGTLNDVVSFETNSITPDKFDLDMIYVGLEHIEGGKGSFNNLETVSNHNIKSTKYMFNENMVLYGKLRPYLNKVALPYFNGVCSTDIIPLLPNSNSNKYYIKYLLSNDYYVRLATEKSSGANLPRISPKNLKKFEVPIPPIELQNQFEIITKKINDIKQYQIESYDELEKLFEIKLQKTFKGEI